MSGFFARQALTADGWAENVRMTFADGRIDSLEPWSQPVAGDVRGGIAIPGMSNAHSHAFQRLLAGHTERRGPQGTDNFWSWRTRMYALADQIDAQALATIATQAYTEMVTTGYTSVAEFHYLHSEGRDASVSDAMFDALRQAADTSGIRLTYVPVLYERAGFSEPDPTPDQLRFALDVETFVEHYRNARKLSQGSITTGIGVHSLRAVSEDSLNRVAGVAGKDGTVMHIHIAEQLREVQQCQDARGARPVRWLLDNCDVNADWCLVHATHIDEDELAGIAGTGAVVCLCPSTEANLGDGLFPLQAFLETGGRIAIGSDSHVSINPFEELRWLEYGQRLVSQRRNIAAIRRPETGRNLFEATADGGARACGQATGHLEEGANADIVVLDDDSPMLAGHTTKSLLDALVFSGFTLPIDRVMVNGDWLVADGRHRRGEQAKSAYVDVANAISFDGAAR